MSKKTFIITLLATILALPVASWAQVEKDGIEADVQMVQVNVSGSRIHITGASGLSFEVYNLSGVRVLSMTIDNDEKVINLHLSRGCYLLKVGKVVRKVNIH